MAKHRKYGEKWDFEGYTGKDAHHTGIYVNVNRSERHIKLFMGIWGMFCFWFTVNSKWVPRYTNLETEDREIGFRVFHGSIWFHFWGCTHGWGPRREWSFTPIDFVFGRMKLDKVLLSDALDEKVFMPEGDYDVTVKVWRYTYWRPRLPFWKDVVKKIEIDCDEGIPIPGKGENAWDMDDDAFFSCTMARDTIDEALTDWRQDILKWREKYGGLNWQPR